MRILCRNSRAGLVAAIVALSGATADAQSLRSIFSSGQAAEGQGSGAEPETPAAPDSPARPPGEIPKAAPPQPEPEPAPRAAPLPPPGTPPPVTSAPPATPAAPAVATPAAPAVVPPSLGGIAASARFGRDGGAIGGGLQWRVYPDKPDATGQFRLLREDKSAAPFFTLPPGGYIVHVSIGLASAAKRVQLQTSTVRETFELAVGGLRIEGKVGDQRIANGQINFDLFRGSQFDGGANRPIASNIGPGELLVLPDGEYHIVSNYGDGNAVLRADVRVQAGKLTEASVQHRAAAVTLKLVSEAGGEALANTAWSVLTPGGDVIKESIGAFPRVVLAEGDYVAIARSEGKVYNREFKVEAGSDQEIEMVAR